MTETVSIQNVVIAGGAENLYGELAMLKHPQGLVILAHNGQGNRKSIPHRYVCQVLHEHNLATLLVDPQSVTENVEETEKVHFFSDVNGISEHLDHMIKWAEKDPMTAFLNIGVFGIGTGAAAALMAAARNQDAVMAVVAQSGHLGSAAQSLRDITAPVLLICGSLEKRKLDSSRKAISILNRQSTLKIIDGAANLLEDPALLEEATGMTAFWFEDNLE